MVYLCRLILILTSVLIPFGIMMWMEKWAGRHVKFIKC